MMPKGWFQLDDYFRSFIKLDGIYMVSGYSDKEPPQLTVWSTHAISSPNSNSLIFYFSSAKERDEDFELLTQALAPVEVEL
jgi:hypothetical protein